MKRVLQFVAITLFAVVGASAARAQSNPLTGTWKLNLEKSKYEPGPAPKSLTRTVDANAEGAKYSFEGVAADGKAIAYGFSVKFDGKDNAISGSMPSGADTIAAKRVDERHFAASVKKGGKEIGTSKVSVSADGKTTTVESTGTSASGAKVHEVQVFDKQ
jgi:hypothetical protein